MRTINNVFEISKKNRGVVNMFKILLVLLGIVILFCMYFVAVCIYFVSLDYELPDIEDIEVKETIVCAE